MEILAALKRTVDEKKPVALCTVVHTSGAVPRRASAKMIVFGDGSTQGTLGGGEVENRVRIEALDSLKDGKPRFLNYNLIDIAKGDPGICGGEVSIYVEPYLRKPTVIVVGAGHVGRSTAFLASWLGFHVVITDDRVELCNPEVTPGGDEYLPVAIQDIPNHITIDSRTYLVLVTRGVDVDVAGIPQFLKTEAPYIGLIGSKRRWERTQEKLREIGIQEEAIQRIKSPIGLPIRAETPDEIAVSIMAEIISIQNQNINHTRTEQLEK